MNLKQIFIAASAFMLFNVAATPLNFSIPSPLAKQSLLLDISKANNGFVTVGERGHILTTDTSANTWQQQKVPVTATLTGVAVVGEDMWAVGHDATIIHSDDNGQTWSLQYSNPDIDKPLLDVLFFDDKHGIAIGAYGLFYRTLDGGDNWTTEIHTSLLFPEDQEYLQELKQESEEDYQLELESILPHLNQLAIDGERLYMVGEMGLVALSDDLGKTWSKIDIGYDGSLFAVNAKDGNVYIGGLRGAIFQSTDQLATSHRLTVQSRVSVNAIILNNEQQYYMGNNGMIIRVQNNAVSEYQIPEEKAILNAVYHADKAQFIFATDIGLLSQEVTK